MARLRHPNVVRVHAIGDSDGRPFVELEYLEGGSLASRLDGTPWARRAAARLIETLAQALAEAHRMGIVHRDLKPANILMTEDGTPKIADFGLAKSSDRDLGLTRTNSIIGSPSYMAPEQAEGRARDVGPAADIYALGAILYELLTGRPPFVGPNVLATLNMVRHAEPVPPRHLQPGISPDLETICLKCLRKDPDHRYASADALAERPDAVPRRRADPGAAGAAVAAGLERGPAPAGGRGRDGRRRPLHARGARARVLAIGRALPPALLGRDDGRGHAGRRGTVAHRPIGPPRPRPSLRQPGRRSSPTARASDPTLAAPLPPRRFSRLPADRGIAIVSRAVPSRLTS